MDPKLLELAEDHFDDLMKNRLPKISEATGIDLDDIGRALEHSLLLLPRDISRRTCSRGGMAPACRKCHLPRAGRRP